MNWLFPLDGGQTKRFHVVDTLRVQDVAAHSFGVAWLCEVLTGGSARKELIMAALAHDLAEHIVGDVPSPTKRVLGVGVVFDAYEDSVLATNGFLKYMEPLTPDEASVLKVADCLDGIHYCVREKALGNARMRAIYSRFLGFTRETIRAMSGGAAQQTAWNIMAQLETLWEAGYECK